MIVEFFFFLFMILAATSAVMVVAARSPVASLMFLVLTLFALAGTFVLLDAHFLAAVQVIIYAGAIMVLFLFVIMLLNLGQDGGTDRRGMIARATALVLGSAVFAAVATGLRAGPRTTLDGGAQARAVAAQAAQAAQASRGAVATIADPLFRDFMVPFEVTSLLLLVAVVGAIVLARRHAP
jgi:NADH-quinone oxidoreductase subunit J